MANKIITSFFTKFGVPQTGLTPTVDIWELDELNPNTNTQVVTAGTAVEIGGGIYRYDFAAYDVTKSYVFRLDGGASLPDGERYSYAGNDSYQEEVAHETWSATSTDYLSLGSMGLIMNELSADTQQLRIDVTSAISLINTLLMYDENRTRIDKVANTLTVYQSDGVTVLRVFDLKDSNGNPSVTEVCERVPV